MSNRRGFGLRNLIGCLTRMVPAYRFKGRAALAGFNGSSSQMGQE